MRFVEDSSIPLVTPLIVCFCAESITEPEILATMKPMIKHYTVHRLDGEHFGDFVICAGYISAMTEGKVWYKGMCGNVS
jgi:sulfite reductase beta subunit-like hemoprotein